MVKQNNNFVLGLFAGITAVSLIVAVILLTKDSGETPTQVNNNEQAVKNIVNNQPPTPPSNPMVDIEVTDKDWYRGAKDAKVTIIEFSDIQCPFCSRHHDTMIKVAEAYPDDVKWVFKHFPLDSLHPYARKASEASECAGDQEKFWEYLDNLFVNQSKLNSEYLSQAAVDLGLDKEKFDTCLSSGKFKDKVNDDYQQGLKAGVRGTPGNIINGQVISGAVPFESLKSTIEELL